MFKSILIAVAVLGILGVTFGLVIALVSKLSLRKNNRDRKSTLIDDVEPTEKRFARVRCSGSTEFAKSKYQYQGIEDCYAAAYLLDGYMQCKFGCLGLGSCVAACERNAISVENGVAVVDKTLCNGCGLCMNACPKHIIELVPEKAEFFVACSSNAKGSETKSGCLAGCVGCKLCERNCPSGAISVVNNLAVLDVDKCIKCGLCVEQCPAGIIRRAK